eukprot:snap_masked-scaffold295_size218279-processed-gene-1.20 protein:Tk09102 transcript:snap_masked-scaffold295_size218279-processed-gene-1.20-mRNA-1 annotation:"uncharacterized glycosyltransferase aer61-like"
MGQAHRAAWLVRARARAGRVYLVWAVLGLAGVWGHDRDHVDWELPKSQLQRAWGHSRACWGYEPGCPAEPRRASIECDGDYDFHRRKPTRTVFDHQADFGYLRNILTTVQPLCRGSGPSGSSLHCSEHLAFCRGQNIMIDFRNLAGRTESLRYSMDVLRQGEIQGQCVLNVTGLTQRADMISPLQSWGPELRFFKGSPKPMAGLDSPVCDVFVERPTVIMKLDATVNMYHHFCDFFNLYASLHLNNSQPSPAAFTRNRNILIWENTPYHSAFGDTFRAFTRHPLLSLQSYAGQRVCFRDIVLPTLPRMIFGLFYNTPLVQGCRKSSLFRAFSEFLLHRLKVPVRETTDSRKIRVTIISRLTQHRRIMNEPNLVDALEQVGDFEVNMAYFTHKYPFLEQVRSVHQTDILVGMHGAGLAHMFFLPPWAVVFELYNCEDTTCYQDLANLCGLQYMTWTNRTALFPQSQDPKLDDRFKAQPKFNNYAFDPQEFVKKIKAGVNLLTQHADYKRLNIQRSHLKDEL